jgi:protein-disulfide isomerase
VKSTPLGKVLMVLMALLGGAALVAAAKPTRATNWNQTVAQTDHDSFLLGNPAAKVKLVEYISYTCPHCSHFEQQSADQLRLGFIAQGKGSIEVRSFVRDPIDMTVAVLTRCGPPARFFTRHSVFLRTQDTWIAPLADGVSPSENQRWFKGDVATRMRYIASDFHFHEIMGTLGIDRTTVDKCLNDAALAQRLADLTQKAEDEQFIHGTPTFMIDGVVLAGTTEWSMLRPQLEARLR